MTPRERERYSETKTNRKDSYVIPTLNLNIINPPVVKVKKKDTPYHIEYSDEPMDENRDPSRFCFVNVAIPLLTTPGDSMARIEDCWMPALVRCCTWL